MKNNYEEVVCEYVEIDTDKWTLDNEAANGECPGSWDAKDRFRCD